MARATELRDTTARCIDAEEGRQQHQGKQQHDMKAIRDTRERHTNSNSSSSHENSIAPNAKSLLITNH